jgi:predicted DNA-binding transcriptional regulator YafY
MARNSQVSRILKVLHLLEMNPVGLSAREILLRLRSDGFTCSRETIYRDLACLQETHMPVTNEGSGESAVWRLDSVVKLSRGVHFSYQELMALYLARESLKTIHTSFVYDLMDGFFQKLEAIFGPRSHQAMRDFAHTMIVQPQSSWVGNVSREVMDTIHQACAEGHVLEIEYQATSGENAGRTTSRKVGPTNLYFAHAGAYLIATDLNDKKMKTFALTRVKRAVMTSEAFDSHSFDPKIQVNASVGIFSAGEIQDIELFVQEPIASYVADRVFHPTQRVVRKENGISLFLQVRVNDDLARWVLSLGSEASVVSPLSLKENVIQIANNVIQANSVKKTG